MKRFLNKAFLSSLMYYFGMIININRIKTEAILIFCRDLIFSYQDAPAIFEIEQDFLQYFNDETKVINKEINRLLKPNSFYIQNKNNFKVKAVLNAYNELNRITSKYLQNDQAFNPMLFYLSFLTSWFVELEKEKNSKEFIFFNIYPFCELYDQFLFKIHDSSYKILNLQTMDIAETIINEFNTSIIKF